MWRLGNIASDSARIPRIKTSHREVFFLFFLVKFRVKVFAKRSLTLSQIKNKKKECMHATCEFLGSKTHLGALPGLNRTPRANEKKHH